MADTSGTPPKRPWKRRGPLPKFTESEKKRRKKESSKRTYRQYVNIGDQVDRWERVKQELAITNKELAARLLDMYELSAVVEKRTEPTENPIDAVGQSSQPPSTPGTEADVVSEVPGPSARDSAVTSTPGLVHVTSETPGPSGISQPFLSGSELSGIQGLSQSEESSTEPQHIISTRAEKREQKKKKIDTSFLDPFELTINLSEDVNFEDDLHDEDYECNLTIGPDKVPVDVDVQDVGFGDDEFGNEDGNEGEDDEAESAVDDDGVQRLKDPAHADRIVDDDKFLVFLHNIMALAKMVKLPCKVKGCHGLGEVASTSRGSALYLTWTCSNGHQIFKWCSQPVLNMGMHAGDLLLSSAVLLSGNNFAKVALFASFVKLKFISSRTFSRIQLFYGIPCIEIAWEEERGRLDNRFKDTDIIVLGDGRMDSPGHCAQFCTYTVMENSTKKIISMECIDKRETNLKSGTMEKEGFVRVMEDLRDRGLKVKEVVTDAHPQIEALMKTDEYNDKKHSNDIWHASKNVGKKVNKAGNNKDCRELQKWTKPVANHFWYCAQHAQDQEEFIGMWYSVMNHVINVHKWSLDITTPGTDRCQTEHHIHDGESKYLEKGSPAHSSLRRIVYDKRLLNKVDYVLNCRSTGELENFNQLVLMYAGKRFAYGPPAYRARNILAALDHNAHIDRDVMRNKDGQIRYSRKFNKKSGRYTVTPVKTPKSYLHINTIMKSIVCERLTDTQGIHRTIPLAGNDPRLIMPSISGIPVPPTAELVSGTVSRF